MYAVVPSKPRLGIRCLAREPRNQLRNNFIVLPPWQSKMDAASRSPLKGSADHSCGLKTRLGRSLPGERFLKEVGERQRQGLWRAPWYDPRVSAPCDPLVIPRTLPSAAEP